MNYVVVQKWHLDNTILSCNWAAVPWQEKAIEVVEDIQTKTEFGPPLLYIHWNHIR